MTVFNGYVNIYLAGSESEPGLVKSRPGKNARNRREENAPSNGPKIKIYDQSADRAREWAREWARSFLLVPPTAVRD
jgi:hypothetical protein